MGTVITLSQGHMDTDEIKRKRELLRTWKQRLYLREVQAAQYGMSVDPAIPIEIEDIKGKISQLEQELCLVGEEASTAKTKNLDDFTSRFPDVISLIYSIIVVFSLVSLIVLLFQIFPSNNNNRNDVLQNMPLEIVPTPQEYEPSPSDPVRIYISSLKIDRPVFPVGMDVNKNYVSPKREVGWFIYSAKPGEGDNIVLWGRRYPIRDSGTPTYPVMAVFENLENINIYDKISIVTREGNTYVYRVISKLAVTPDKVEYLSSTGKEQLTLIGAVGDIIPAGDNLIDKDKKLVIIAEPVK